MIFKRDLLFQAIAFSVPYWLGNWHKRHSSTHKARHSLCLPIKQNFFYWPKKSKVKLPQCRIFLAWSCVACRGYRVRKNRPKGSTSALILPTFWRCHTSCKVDNTTRTACSWGRWSIRTPCPAIHSVPRPSCLKSGTALLGGNQTLLAVRCRLWSVSIVMPTIHTKAIEHTFYRVPQVLFDVFPL